MSCINWAGIVPWHDKWHRAMTNQQTVPVPFPIGGWHWHSDAKNGLITWEEKEIEVSNRRAGYDICLSAPGFLGRDTKPIETAIHTSGIFRYFYAPGHSNRFAY